MQLRGTDGLGIHKVTSSTGKGVISDGVASLSNTRGDTRNKSTQGGSAMKDTTGGMRDQAAYNFGILSQSIQHDFEEPMSPGQRNDNFIGNKTATRISRYRKQRL